jgi:hypothetical protein
MKFTEWLEARNQAELDKLIKRHGRELRVRVVGTWDGDMRLEGRELHSLDLSGAHVRGAVCAREARISWNLDIRGAQIGEDLHAYKAHIGGSLFADEAQIAGFLVVDEARIGGAMNLVGARIGRSVSADHASIGGSVDANGARIGGALTYHGAQIASGIVMPDAMHGMRGRAVAQCSGFILWRDDAGYYYAGCRGPLTRDEALAHWGAHRHDERARVFSAAIQAIRKERANAQDHARED